MIATIFSGTHRPKNLSKKGIAIYIDKSTVLEINESEKNSYDFFETEIYWCLVLGDVSIKNPAKLIINNYKENIASFLLAVDGNFLVLVYSKKTNSILTFCDPLGLGHAYYTTTPDGFCLSSSIDNVLLFRKSYKSHVSESALNLYLTFQYIPNPYTFITEIQQIPLHSTVFWENQKIATKRIFDSYIEVFQKSVLDTKEDLTEILTKSLRRQIPENEKVIGAFLSGGMDTSTNIAILQNFLNIKPIAFTAAFSESDYNEEVYAKIVAERFKLRHVVIAIKPELIKDLSLITQFFDNPIADRAILPEYLLCLEAKRMGITYMVSGEGGDEVLGIPRNLPSIDFLHDLPKNDGALAEYYLNYSGLIQKDIRRELLPQVNNNNYLEELYHNLKNSNPFEKILYGQWQTWMIDNVLVKDYQLFKHFEFGFVNPFMNKELMKKIFMMPPEKKIDLLTNKSYFKQKMGGLLPPEIINKPKHKFQVPIKEWLQGELYNFTYESLLSQNSKTQDFLDKNAIKKLLVEHKKEKKDYNRPIWALLFLEHWYRNKAQFI